MAYFDMTVCWCLAVGRMSQWTKSVGFLMDIMSWRHL